MADFTDHRQFWTDIKKWELANRPKDKSGELNPPATENEIQNLESLVKRELPADFKSYLQAFNGTNWFEPWWTPFGLVLLSTGDILKQFNFERRFETENPDEEVDDPDQSDRRRINTRKITTPKRIPIAGETNIIYLDFNPGEKGQSGQITITFEYMESHVLAWSFIDLMQAWYSLYQSGKIIYSEERYSIVTASEKDSILDLIRNLTLTN